VFFTLLGREEKYKAKNLIDVVINRGSDALYCWVFDSLQALGLKLGAIGLDPENVERRRVVHGADCGRPAHLVGGLGRSQEEQARHVEEIDATPAVQGERA
jgi:hypothetical protein